MDLSSVISTYSTTNLPPVFEGLTPTLVVTIGALISLGILLFVISYYAYFPTKNYLEARKKHIQSNIDSAVKANSEAHLLLTQADQKYRNIEIEANQYFEKQKDDADIAKENILTEARKQATKLLQENQKELMIQKESFVEQMKDDVAKMSILVAEKIIKENLNDEKNNELIDEFIKGLEN